MKGILEKLRSAAAQLVKMALRGRYQELVSEELPPQCRFGFIRRSTWWARLGRESLFDDGKVEQDEARELAELIAAQPDEETIGRLPEPSILSADLNAVQVGMLLGSLDFCMRMWMGQYGEVEWRMRYTAHVLEVIEADQPLRERKWRELRNLVLPELKGMGLSGSYGIWNPEVSDRAQSAYDMKQVIRHAWSWHRNPAGGIGVNFDTPWIRGLLPAVGCSCSGEGEESRCLIQLLPAHARLAIEALEVSRLAVLGKMRELMEHYTDGKEALSVTREIEELVPALAGEWGRDLAEGLEELIATFEGLLVQRSCDSAEA